VVIDSRAELSRPPPLRYTVSLAYNLSFLRSLRRSARLCIPVCSLRREGRAMRGPPRLSSSFIDCGCSAFKALSTRAMFIAASCISIAPGCVARRRWCDRQWARGSTLGRSRPSAAGRTLATYRQGLRRSVSGPCRRPQSLLPSIHRSPTAQSAPSNSISAAPAGRSKLRRLAVLLEHCSISSIDADSQARHDLQPLSATEHDEGRASFCRIALTEVSSIPVRRSSA